MAAGISCGAERSRPPTGTGDRGGARIACRVPAATTALRLTLAAQAPQYRAVARAVWLEPGLLDPGAPPAPTPVALGTEPIRRSSPVISVLTPVHDPPLRMLREAVESVRSQSYGKWELCLTDDGSCNPEVIAALAEYASSDPRVKLTRHDQARGIAHATNAAMAMATGEYVALLDHDDTLSSEALTRIAETLSDQPDLDMVYTDEDILLDGRQIWVHHKPAWSPDTMRTNGYTCHLGVYRRTLVESIGGFRTEYNGSQDVDMILRLIERTNRIGHVPEILYHWRAHAASTAGGDAKPYAYVAARNAIDGHLQRTGLRADVGYGPPGLYRVVHRVDVCTTIDLVLAVDNVAGLGNAAASWMAQPHRAFNVVIAAPAQTHGDIADALTAAGIPATDLRLVAVDHGTNRGAALAAAASRGESDHLLLMGTPAAGVSHDWLTRLIGYSAQSGIAAAGPVVVAPDGRIQDAGVAVPAGFPLHLLHGTRSSMDNFFGYGTSVYNVAAVSGAMATSRGAYTRLDGLRDGPDDLAMTDYCLRGLRQNLRIVTVPDARLKTTVPVDPSNDLPRIWRFRDTWGRHIGTDPFYNQNYRYDRGDFERRRN